MARVENTPNREHLQIPILEWEVPSDATKDIHKAYFALHGLDVDAKIILTSREEHEKLELRVKALNNSMDNMSKSLRVDQLEPDAWEPVLPIIIARHPAWDSVGSYRPIRKTFAFYRNNNFAHEDETFMRYFIDLMNHTNKYIDNTNKYAPKDKQLIQFPIPHELLR